MLFNYSISHDDLTNTKENLRDMNKTLLLEEIEKLNEKEMLLIMSFIKGLTVNKSK